jgi:hypothetical protein
MIKLIISLLIGLVLVFLGYKVFLDDRPVSIPGMNQPASPSDAIDSAEGAAQKTQNLQNEINNEAQKQLNGY